MNHPTSRRRGAVPRRALAAVAATVASFVFASTAQAYDAEITRTTGGIAHIKAGNLADAGFGVGYAAAQDNICTLADTILTAQGQRAEFLGPGADNANVVSDFFWADYKAQGNVERILAMPEPMGPSPDARALTSGYVAGYNQYLADQGGSAGIKDPRCKGADWVRPVTALDMWRVANMLGMRASTAQVASGIVYAQPPAPAAIARSGSARNADDPIAELASEAFEDLGRDERIEPVKGSNAVGAGKNASTSGNSGVVLGNPHFPWAGNERFWEFGIEVPGDVKAVGAGLMGSPVPNIGHNEHVAWSHTVSTGQRFAFHALQLVPGNPTQYVVDGGAPRQMTKRTVAVKVNVAGALATQTRDLYSSEFGPLVGIPGQLEWSGSQAFAINDANRDNLRLFDQWLAMNRADDAYELVQSQKDIQGIPWVNTIGADDKGNAFYTDLAVVPNYSNAQLAAYPTGCNATPPALAARNLTMLVGIASCKPGTDVDAVQPGIMGPSKQPVRITQGWVQNANDSFWLTNPDAAEGGPITGFSPLIGKTNVQQGLRTRLGLDLIGKRMAGTDGLPGTKFSLETMKGMWLNHRSLGAELTLDALVALCKETPSVARACPALAAYGKTGKKDDKGGWLFSRWFDFAQADPAMWANPYDPANPATTPNTLNVADATAKGKIIAALVKAIDELDARGVPLDASHGDVQHTMRGNERISIPGCNTGCYPVTAARTGASNYGQVYTGSSFVMFAEMGPQGPRAQALLSYSQSEDSTSPFYADQTKRFSNLEFIDLPFTAAEIAAAKIQPPATPTTPTPQPQPQPNPPAAGPVLKPAAKAKVKLSDKAGFSLRIFNFGGRKLAGAKVTLPKGWAFDAKRAKRKADLKVTATGSKVKTSVKSRTLTVRTASGAENLRVKGSGRLIRKTSTSKKKKTVTVSLTLTFTDGSKQTQKLKVRAA